MVKGSQWLLTLLGLSLFVALAILLLGHFILLAVFGEVTHYEPNLAILYTELGLSTLLFGFALGMYINFIRRRR